MHEKWTEKEIKVLKKNYGKKSLKELMEILPNRCHDGIRSKAKRLDLKRK